MTTTPAGQDPPLDLTVTDPVIDLGRRVLGLLEQGYDGPQITAQCNVGPAEAALALGAYAGRILFGTVPPKPSPECGPPGAGYDGWCYIHGVFHPDHRAPDPGPGTG